MASPRSGEPSWWVVVDGDLLWAGRAGNHRGLVIGSCFWNACGIREEVESSYLKVRPRI